MGLLLSASSPSTLAGENTKFVAVGSKYVDVGIACESHAWMLEIMVSSLGSPSGGGSGSG